MSLEEYVNKYYQMAAQVASPGVPIALILSHSFLESGKGASVLTTKGNNFFGVKSLPDEPFITLKTKEVINGKEITLYQNFKLYPSALESFTDYVKLLNKPRYKPVLAASGIANKFAALGKAGYFTAGNSYIKTATIIGHQVEEMLKKFNPNILPLFLISFFVFTIAFLNK